MKSKQNARQAVRRASLIWVALVSMATGTVWAQSACGFTPTGTIPNDMITKET